MESGKEGGAGGGRGKPQPAAELLPLVYEDLLRLATRQLARGGSGQAFEAADLVHEAWLRLGSARVQGWNHQGHFLAAAVEAMRRILVEAARRAGRLKRGGGWECVELDRVPMPAPMPEEGVVALEEALRQLAAQHFPAAELVRLRFFVGLTQLEAARALGLSRSGADRVWLFARGWLLNQLRPTKQDS